MPKYLPVGAIRRMSYEELERWWEVDFDVLTSTAVAEATGPVMPSVAEALRSDDWLEQWADALYAASGQLKSSVERMEYAGDPRLEKTEERSGKVAQRVGHVNSLLRTLQSQQGWELLPAHHKDARGASLAILAWHHREEAKELAAAETARRGLAPHHPLWDRRRDTKIDVIEESVRLGLIHAPVTPEVKALLSLPPHALTNRVAADATRQEDRCAELRHPLLLRGWAEGLEHLRDRHCALAGIEPVFSVSLPRLDMRALRAMSREEAMVIINRRRFIRALAQRRREYEMYARELGRTAAVREGVVKQPWDAAVQASREELARRYPEQFEALLTAFKPFCVPGATEICREYLGKRAVIPHQVIPSLKKALADGTWRKLLV